MVTRARRRLAGALARWAVRIDPDPPTVVIDMSKARRVHADYPAADHFDMVRVVSDAVSGHIGGRSVAGRPFSLGGGTEHAY